MTNPTLIAENLKSIHTQIAAAQSAGRNPAAITLIAVCKTHSAEAVAAAQQAGVTNFGENRIQEAATKFPRPCARLHIIGPIQTNKLRQAIQIADSIDTLDREKLSDAIAKESDAAGKLPDLLIQINIGDEPQKSGIPTAQADAFIRAQITRFGPSLRGLMCIPPEGQDPTPYFRHLASLADTHGLVVRSMGMSNDFPAAIACGATHIRVGSAIFGARPTK
jgi:pyridoxal phosphate enzyme (YggS family)